MGDHWMRVVISSRAKWQHSVLPQYPLKALSMQTDKNWYPRLNISVQGKCQSSKLVIVSSWLKTKHISSALQLWALVGTQAHGRTNTKIPFKIPSLSPDSFLRAVIFEISLRKKQHLHMGLCTLSAYQIWARGAPKAKRPTESTSAQERSWTHLRHEVLQMK